jgi:hypothetical protein
MLKANVQNRFTRLPSSILKGSFTITQLLTHLPNKPKAMIVAVSFLSYGSDVSDSSSSDEEPETVQRKSAKSKVIVPKKPRGTTGQRGTAGQKRRRVVVKAEVCSLSSSQLRYS